MAMSQFVNSAHDVIFQGLDVNFIFSPQKSILRPQYIILASKMNFVAQIFIYKKVTHFVYE